jgi:hypothetical protein
MALQSSLAVLCLMFINLNWSSILLYDAFVIVCFFSNTETGMDGKGFAAGFGEGLDEGFRGITPCLNIESLSLISSPSFFCFLVGGFGSLDGDFGLLRLRLVSVGLVGVDVVGVDVVDIGLVGVDVVGVDVVDIGLVDVGLIAVGLVDVVNNE